MAQQLARTLRRLPTPESLTGAVVHGFGRGSAQLGFPTANLEIDWSDAEKAPAAGRIRNFVDSHDTGIYAAWAQVADGANRGVYKAAVSVGWNPHFGDLERKTIEAWLLHDFAEDFYGRMLRLQVVGYVRPELKFDSLDGLVAAIRADGDFCEAALGAAPEDSAFFAAAAA
jgi:riboflavin kinase